MTIREKVARAISEGVHSWTIRSSGEYQRTYCPFCQMQIVDHKDHRKTCKEFLSLSHTVITAFLEAAAEEGRHMWPDEATEEMIIAVGPAPDYWIENCYIAMQAAAPEFEWGKKTSSKPGKPPSGRI